MGEQLQDSQVYASGQGDFMSPEESFAVLSHEAAQETMANPSVIQFAEEMAQRTLSRIVEHHNAKVTSTSE